MAAKSWEINKYAELLNVTPSVYVSSVYRCTLILLVDEYVAESLKTTGNIYNT